MIALIQSTGLGFLDSPPDSIRYGDNRAIAGVSGILLILFL